MVLAGFEPAHPKIVGLKSTALDHSAMVTFTDRFNDIHELNNSPMPIFSLPDMFDKRSNF